MDDTLALLAEHTALLTQAWRTGDLATSAESCRQIVYRAGVDYPAVAVAATHWLSLTVGLTTDDPVRRDAALALLVSAVRRAQTVANA